MAKELVLSESTPHELEMSGLPQSIQVEDALHESVRVEPIVSELLAETAPELQPSIENTRESFGSEGMAELIAEMNKEDDQLVPTLKITEALIVSET